MKAFQKTISHWGFVSPYAQIPHSDSEYERLLNFADELMEVSRHKKDKRITTFLSLVARNIEEYETRRFPANKVTPIEMLEFLMDQHGLGQSDLPEIGGQSLVSKILSGERKLTADHIGLLSKRFGVSPAVFYSLEENNEAGRKGNVIKMRRRG